MLDYCRTAQAFADREQFRVLFLDKRNQLIADELQQVGTVDHTPVCPREVVKRALELSATAIILVHNHPSGDPTPSRADIQMTRQIIAVADPLGISVHDQIIVGKEGHSSLKVLKLVWLRDYDITIVLWWRALRLRSAPEVLPRRVADGCGRQIRNPNRR